METVEIVIRIPKEYKDYIEGGAGIIPDKIIQCLFNALDNGIVLPKGHGRLIDADAVLEDPYGNTYKDINIAETIIEADKEVENGP